MEAEHKEIILAGDKVEVKGLILTAGIKDYVISKRSMKGGLVEYKIKDDEIVRTILTELSKGNNKITLV